MKKNDVWGRSVPINFIFLFRVMKLCFLFLVIFNLAVVAAGSAQVKRVSLTMENAELRQVFKKLKQQTGLRFFFNEEKLKREDVRQIDIQNLELDKALDKILEGTELTYIFLKDVVVIKDRQEDRVQAILKDKRLITGVVRDEKGISLPGVSVIVKGTQTGVATNVDGYFEIKVDDDPGLVLQFSFVGMKNKEMRIGDSYKLKIVLESAAENLDEVIVTGYQTISKERATGSYSVISAKEYENKLQDNILARIEGQVAGLVSYKNENTIRGVSTVYGNTDPLYVVDGMPYEGSLNAINPADVVNITVLKDATAASIYGARAANGVIVITTRKGKSGKMKLTYNGSVRFEPIPDLDYLDLMSGSELIDMQIEGFHYYHSEYGRLNKRVAINEIDELLYKHEANELTDDELAEQLAVYRNSDRKNQVKKELLRTAVKHQHNLSVSGGNETNRYLFSLNYLGDNPHEKFQKNNRIGFTLKDNLDLCGWLSVELGVSSSYTRNKGFNGISGLDLYQSGPSYRMLRDENGDAKVWDNYKSEYEIERLKSLGLRDETYIPLDEIKYSDYKNTSAYYRTMAGLNFRLWEGVNLELKYQQENTVTKNNQFYDKNSHQVRNMMNNAAHVDKSSGAITWNVPEGAHRRELRQDISAYTLRAQLNFNRRMKEIHDVSILFGGERRCIRTTSTQTYRMGYDPNSLAYKPIDPIGLSYLTSTEAVSGYFSWDDQLYNKFLESEDRFVSFYGNGSYIYGDRYGITASVRMDQSNLFGTDPKYQYRPLWSVGGSWFASNENFLNEVDWLNRLTIRVTYGINGNISKLSGPYLTVKEDGYNSWTDDFGASIKNPPNNQLRWEKTKVFNTGLDFTFLKNRLAGTVDWYSKKSSDLLGYRSSDPTVGWSSILVNYGSMVNRGIEVTLNSKNIVSNSFEWTTSAIFSYNKNKIVDIENRSTLVSDFVTQNVNTEGHPLKSLFSYRWAGLDENNGSPLVYNENGEKVKNVNTVEELVYSGTVLPSRSASFTNRFTFQRFELSFMFIYNGGHVIRDAAPTYLTGEPGTNLSRSAMNYWRQKGDEQKPGVAPAMNRSASYTTQQVWYSADCHILKADYIKLREINLSYHFPKRIIDRLQLQGVTLNCQINNVWRWQKNSSGIDPEAYSTTSRGWGQRTLPVPTTYILGLSINL